MYIPIYDALFWLYQILEMKRKLLVKEEPILSCMFWFRVFEIEFL